MARQPSDARNNPVVAGPNEYASANIPVPQRDPINMDEKLRQRADGISEAGIEIADRMPERDHADALKFGEDPVTVVLSASSDRNAPKHVYCAVNGKGAEVWDERTKRWLEFTWLPVSRVITVKRKYLEVLARTRTETFRTEEVTPTPLANQDGFRLASDTVAVAPFQVRNDPAGARGHEWFERVCTEY